MSMSEQIGVVLDPFETSNETAQIQPVKSS